MAPGIVSSPQRPAAELTTTEMDVETAVERQMEPVDEDAEDATIADLSQLRSFPEPPSECQVCVVGAGPAGLMMAATLTRYGINVEVVDDRADQTPVGR